MARIRCSSCPGAKSGAKAEHLAKRGLAILEKALGAEHREVATSLDILAGIFARQRHYAQAGLFYRRALAIQEKVFGPDHPATLATRNRVGAAEAEVQESPRDGVMTELALGASPGDLARSWMGVVAVLLGNPGIMHEVFGQSERKVPAVVVHTYHDVDGQTYSVIIAGIEELDAFIVDHGRLHASFAEAIERRGHAELTGRYDAVVSDECSPGWLKPGEVTVTQHEFEIEVRQDGRSRYGITIESMVTLVAADYVTLIHGVFKEGIIDMSDRGSGCTMALIPK